MIRCPANPVGCEESRGKSMTKLHQDDQTEPCFITDGPPASDLPIPPYRTMNLPQILASLTDDELVRWSGDLADAERERRCKAGS